MENSMNKNNVKRKYSLKDLLRFIFPSITGILLFMTPIPLEGEVTIPIAFLSKFIQTSLENYLPLIMTILITSSCVFTLIIKIFKPSFLMNNDYLKKLLDVTPLWVISRIIGMILAICTFFKLGSKVIYSENTGGLLLYSLLPILFAVFLFAGLLLPLILDFGLLEFFGTLLTKVMRPIFNLPGRSSIDCITSWLGDGTIGVLLTSKQYEEGYYSKREAAIIGTSFSAVSITFCLVVISQVGLGHMFLPFYLTVTLSGIAAAVITPRIPPLSRKSDTYFNDNNKSSSEVIPEGYSALNWGFEQAIEKSQKNTNVRKFLTDGFKNVFDMWLGVTPIVMAMGTIALILAEYTPIFKWLGMPFIPLLQLLQIPEAQAASSTLVVGFADMFLPSVIAASTIKSPITLFIIAAVSVTQLIYMSEVGGLLIGSKIPVNFKELFIIFIERTLITLPIISVIAHIIF
ncbi:YjiH family protein [Clostridium sp. KNHs214]|uniref:YjiH family protein n=1 Tax=Clostridium sp. KNHs214 TaxID=1540257 RepID=UPI000550A0FF|nr:YjiH family protein [Clostridium sp. KNHs214]